MSNVEYTLRSSKSKMSVIICHFKVISLCMITNQLYGNNQYVQLLHLNTNIVAIKRSSNKKLTKITYMHQETQTPTGTLLVSSSESNVTPLKQL